MVGNIYIKELQHRMLFCSFTNQNILKEALVRLYDRRKSRVWLFHMKWITEDDGTIRYEDSLEMGAILVITDMCEAKCLNLYEYLHIMPDKK